VLSQTTLLLCSAKSGAPDSILHARYRRHQLISVALKGNAVEKAYGIDSDVDAGSRKFPLLDQVIKPVRNLLVGNEFWRTVIIARKLRDVPAVRLLGALCSATNGKIPMYFARSGVVIRGYYAAYGFTSPADRLREAASFKRPIYAETTISRMTTVCPSPLSSLKITTRADVVENPATKTRRTRH
jgi:hypothetical protein